MPRITDYNNFKDPGAEESERGFRYDTSAVLDWLDPIYCCKCGQNLHTFVDTNHIGSEEVVAMCPVCALEQQ